MIGVKAENPCVTILRGGMPASTVHIVFYRRNARCDVGRFDCENDVCVLNIAITSLQDDGGSFPVHNNGVIVGYIYPTYLRLIKRFNLFVAEFSVIEGYFIQFAHKVICGRAAQHDGLVCPLAYTCVFYLLIPDAIDKDGMSSATRIIAPCQVNPLIGRKRGCAIHRSMFLCGKYCFAILNT